MKLVRYGNPGKEKPGLIDTDGKLRDLSAVLPDIGPAQLSQAALANEVMSPSDSEVDRAERILKAMADAEKTGKGAVSLDGRLIDYASIRQAEVLIEKVKQVATA